MTSLFLRDFSVLDFASLSPEHGLRGESFYVSAELEGSLDAHGFVLDFSRAKKALKALVDETLDHKLVSSLPNKASGLENISYSAPEEAILELPVLSMEGLEAYLALQARAVLPANVEKIRFCLREDPRFAQEANFRYTHGLQFHDGNCQRLFHGHRNPIEVWAGAERLPALEAKLAQEWEGVHFASVSTLKNRAALDLPLGRRQFDHPGLAEISYRSPQGEFRAELPSNRIVLLEGEPSIENIAALGYQRLQAEGASPDIRVTAYEGLNKGASFCRRNAAGG